MSNIVPISKLGYGCYGFSGVYGAQLSESEMVNIIQESYQLGIRLFDTASSYGNTEELLGKAVKPFRKQVSIITKVGFREDGVPDLSLNTLIVSCERSLKRLETDYIDNLQIHYDDSKTSIEETVFALETLRKQGKILSYGVSHLPIDRVKEYLKLGNVSSVLGEINALNIKRYIELRNLQREYEFGIIAFSITGRGLLTGKVKPATVFPKGDIRQIDPLFRRSKLKGGIEIASKLGEVGNRYGITPTQVAINWTLQNPGIVSALTGPTKIKHLQENIGALKIKIDERCMEEINSYLIQQHKFLQNCLRQDVLNILYEPLPSDLRAASNDLIYVLEYALEENLLSHERGIDLYGRILTARKETKPRNEFECIMNELKALGDFGTNINTK